MEKLHLKSKSSLVTSTILFVLYLNLQISSTLPLQSHSHSNSEWSKFFANAGYEENDEQPKQSETTTVNNSNNNNNGSSDIKNNNNNELIDNECPYKDQIATFTQKISKQGFNLTRAAALTEAHTIFGAIAMLKIVNVYYEECFELFIHNYSNELSKEHKYSSDQIDSWIEKWKVTENNNGTTEKGGGGGEEEEESPEDENEEEDLDEEEENDEDEFNFRSIFSRKL